MDTEHLKKVQTNLIESRLIFILANVNEWLRFAELKNGAILAFGGVCVFGILTFIATYRDVSPAWIVGLAAGLICLFVSCLLSILSFHPRLKKIESRIWKETDECKDEDNLIYYGDLCKYSKAQLLELFSKKYSIGATDEMSIVFCEDLADQIINNSQIAKRKLRLFIGALWALLLTIPAIVVFTGLFALIFYAFRYPR